MIVNTEVMFYSPLLQLFFCVYTWLHNISCYYYQGLLMFAMPVNMGEAVLNTLIATVLSLIFIHSTILSTIFPFPMTYNATTPYGPVSNSPQSAAV